MTDAFHRQEDAPQGPLADRQRLPRMFGLGLFILALGCRPAPPVNPDSSEAPTKTEATADADAAAVADAPSGSPEKVELEPVEPLVWSEILERLRAGERQRVREQLQGRIDELPTEDRVWARYVLGREWARVGDARAIDLLETPPHSALTEAAALHRFRALDATRDARAYEFGVDFLERFPANSDADVIRLRVAELSHEKGDLERSQRLLERVAKRGDTRERRGRAAVTLCELERMESPDNAKKCFEEAAIRFPDTAAASLDALEPYGVSVDDLSDYQRFLRAKTLADNWAYAEARTEFRRLVKRRRHLYEALWQIGVISLRKLRDDPTEALAVFRRVFTLPGARKEEALHYMMMAHMRLEQYDKALELADQYEELYPRGKYIDRIAYYRGWLPYDHGKCREALPHLWKYWKKHRSRRTIVLGFYAWCFVRLKQWERAVTAMSSLAVVDNPVVGGKGLYWRAYAKNELGRRDEALTDLDELEDRYPLSWYQMLGAQMRARWLGQDPTASKLPWPEGGGRAGEQHPLPVDAWNWPKLAGDLADRFRDVQALVAADEPDRARTLWTPIRGRVEAAVTAEQRLPFVRFMAHAIEDHRHAWVVATGGRLNALTGMPDPTDIKWLLAYPRAYRPLVERLAEERDLPSHFIYAVMRQESRYNPAAVSHADAVGALQMIPPTARRVAKDLGTTYDQDLFFDPRVGFTFSTFYLDKHRKLWNGQLALTAASYNGGPEPIARWMRQRAPQKLDLAHLVEEFAYNESRIYCRKVVEHTLRYLYLYESDPHVRGRWLDALFPANVNYEVPEDVGY